jgi:protease IV
MELPALGKSKVAVVEIAGQIGVQVRSRQFAPMLKALREDKRVRAVVLDIDSPGGGASDSDYIYESVRALQAEKPVIAFIRGTGASGAYFIACAAERIVAQRSAIVGSIGVITLRPQVQQLLDKIGVQINVTATGPLKGMGLPFREETPEEHPKTETLITQFFDHFLDVVAEGRKVDRETARGWATGEIFWAPQALERGMVDELGGLEQALAVAARLGGVSEKNAVTVRPHQPLVQRLLQRSASAAAQAIAGEAVRLFSARVEYR